ncbi:conserved membrane hypothetical protein [uncultured Gammaproteobacteria bacterium]
MPKTSDELYRLYLILCISYLAASYIVWGVVRLWAGNVQTMNYVNRIFDSITFSTSLLALAAIFDNGVFLLLGDMKPFLIIAGLCGVTYSIHALFKH